MNLNTLIEGVIHRMANAGMSPAAIQDTMFKHGQCIQIEHIRTIQRKPNSLHGSNYAELLRMIQENKCTLSACVKFQPEIKRAKAIKTPPKCPIRPIVEKASAAMMIDVPADLKGVEFTKEYQRQYDRLRRARLIDAGLCVRCGSHQTRDGRLLCQSCSDNARARYAEKKKVA